MRNGDAQNRVHDRYRVKDSSAPLYCSPSINEEASNFKGRSKDKAYGLERTTGGTWVNVKYTRLTRQALCGTLRDGATYIQRATKQRRERRAGPGHPTPGANISSPAPTSRERAVGITSTKATTLN